MLFTSVDFIFFFAALLVLLALVRNSRARFWIVLIASYVFYAAWDWRLLGLLLACSLWNWSLGLVIQDAPDQRRRKASSHSMPVVFICAMRIDPPRNTGLVFKTRGRGNFEMGWCGALKELASLHLASADSVRPKNDMRPEKVGRRQRCWRNRSLVGKLHARRNPPYQPCPTICRHRGRR